MRRAEDMDSLYKILEDITERLVRIEGILSNRAENESRLICTTKMSKIYSISKSQQKILRSRIVDPLPYVQDKRGGKIRYDVMEVEKWLIRQKS